MTIHESVLLDEAIHGLAIKPDGIYVDGTLGRGGHSQAILRALGSQGRLFVIDKDPEAIRCAEALWAQDPRVVISHDSFRCLAEIATQFDIRGRVDGVLLDLGVSSPQLDVDARGFSFLKDGELDMRMDNTRGVTAAKWLAEVGEQALADVLFEYGEERYSRRIAKSICLARQEEPIKTTVQLANIISKAHPAWEKNKHPATRSFQAIRIFINSELSDLEQGLDAAAKVLAPQGRLVVISFHSLEDRIVKQFITGQLGGQFIPRGLPIREAELKKSRLFTEVGKPIKPSLSEIGRNPRARSAILRVASKN